MVQNNCNGTTNTQLGPLSSDIHSVASTPTSGTEELSDFPLRPGSIIGAIIFKPNEPMTNITNHHRDKNLEHNTTHHGDTRDTQQ